MVCSTPHKRSSKQTRPGSESSEQRFVPRRTPQGKLSFLHKRKKEEGDMKGFKGNDEDSGQGRISRGVEVSGDVLFADALQVDGKVTGKLMSESGSLMIEQTGDIQ